MNGESLERFKTMGLTLTTSPTRVPPGAAVIAQNCWRDRRGSINSRPGYRRWLEVYMAAPVTCVMVFYGKRLVTAGNVDESGDATC